MRKNIILIGFTLALIVGGHVFAKTGDISMGTFSIPSPGCAPEVTISDEKDANGCYTMTIQNKTIQNGTCSSSGITPTTKQVCDGRDGAGGGAIDVTKEYVPYPDSTFDGAEPQNEGYIKVTIPAADDNEGDTILKYPDYCEIGVDPEGQQAKKCNAQGNAKSWPDVTGNHNVYQDGDTYIFPIDALASGYPRQEYVMPVLSGGTTGYPIGPGQIQKIYKYESGRETRVTVAFDDCPVYARSTDTSDQVKKCTVGASAGTPGLSSPYTAGATYCLDLANQSNCSLYTIPVGAVDACAGLTSSDNAWTTTVSHSESEYIEHVYPVGGGTCTTNCTGTVGYKLTKETMCDGGNPRENTQNDNCSSATPPSNVTCAPTYAYQTCTPVDSRGGSGSYSGCFPDPLNGLYAHKDEIVPADFAADSNYLYYCKVANCKVAACWVGDTIGGTPYYNDGNGCWGRVSINGLQGADGKSCFVTNDGTNWNMCCSPSYAGNDCSIITDQDIIDKLNGMMCQVNYTHKYLHDNNGGDPIANDTKAGAIGERIIVTNTCNSDAENLDSIYGTDGAPGNDYNPCDGLEPGSVAAQTTIQSQTSVYVSNTSSSNIFTPKVGYYQTTTNMCEGNPQITYKQDKCIPVSLATGDSRTVGTITCAANQTLMRCTPQAGASTDPYFICENAEVSGYPEKQYVAPAGTNGVLNTAGYTRWAHRYTSSSAIIYTKIDDDSCQNAVKKSRNSQDTTTTTRNVLKCTVQNPGTTGYNEGSSYCLFMASGENCDDYIIAGSEVEEYETKYMSPTGSDGVLTKEGYTCKQRKLTRTAAGSTNPVVVEEPCQLVEKDTCNKAVKYTRTTSNQVVNMVEKSLLKCEVQDPGNSSYTAGMYYCLNLGGGENCADYNIVGDMSEQSQDEYVAPTVSDGKPTSVGYLRTSVTNTRFASGSQTYYTNERKDPGRKVYNGTSSTIKYTVQAPGAGSGTFETGAEYCIGLTIAECATYKDDDPCANLTSEEAKKKVKSIQYEYVTKDNSGLAGVGYSKKTTTMCNTAGNTTEYIYDTCVSVAAASGCNGTNDKNYKCYNQTQPATASASAREYNTCNPSESAVALSSAVANKLDSDVTFTTGTYNNKDYILMSATGVANKPVVAVESLQGASALELWKEQQTDNTTCQKLFSKNCNALGLTEFMQDISDYGTWAREELQDNPNASANDLSRSSYRATLQPCQGGFSITEDDTYSGTDGKRYTMTCND